MARHIKRGDTVVVITGADISKLQLLTLNDPAVRSLTPSLAFNQPVNLGEGAPARAPLGTR